MTHTTVGHSMCDVAGSFSLSLSVLIQISTCQFGLFGCCRSKTDPNWVSETFLFTVCCPTVGESVSTVGFFKLSFNCSTDFCSSLPNSGRNVLRFFCCFFFSGAAICKKLGQNHQKSLQGSKHNRTFVYLVNYFNPRTASDVFRHFSTFIVHQNGPDNWRSPQ